MKKSLYVLAVAALLNCGSKPPPEVIDRELPSKGDPTKRQYTPYIEDAGQLFVDDAGICCTVRFAFNAQGAETQAVLVGSALPNPKLMTRNGNVWETSVCVYPVDMTYYGVVSVPGDEPDSGVLEFTVFNGNAPTTPSDEFGTVNRFNANGFMACSALDAGVYGDTSVPAYDGGVDDGGAPVDAGSGSDAGSTDAGGALPIKTTITGSCDTLTTPTVLLSTTNNSPLLDDDFAPTTALPFSLNYFGTPVTHFAVNMNGFVQLLTSVGGATAVTDNEPIPSATAPNGVVAPLWDDLTSALTGTSALRTQVFGAGNTRHLTVEWQNLGFLFSADSERVTFQAKFFEGTNAIEFHYCTLAANGGTTTFEQGFSATVGLENLTGTAGVQHSKDSPVLTTSAALHFE